MLEIKVTFKQADTEKIKALKDFLTGAQIKFEEKQHNYTVVGRDGSPVPFSFPFGKHKGKSIEDVPLDYLLWVKKGQDDPETKFRVNPDVMKVILVEIEKRVGRR